MPKQSTKDAGKEGEEIALRHLKELGLAIIETNYRYGKSGEIDIIAKDGDVLVFCEVKLRKSDMYGDPEFGVTPRKQTQVRKLAEIYLWDKQIENQECRFDVVAIKKYPGMKMEINYIPSAFWIEFIEFMEFVEFVELVELVELGGGLHKLYQP